MRNDILILNLHVKKILKYKILIILIANSLPPFCFSIRHTQYDWPSVNTLEISLLLEKVEVEKYLFLELNQLYFVCFNLNT